MSKQIDEDFISAYFEELNLSVASPDDGTYPISYNDREFRRCHVFTHSRVHGGTMHLVEKASKWSWSRGLRDGYEKGHADGHAEGYAAAKRDIIERLFGEEPEGEEGE